MMKSLMHDEIFNDYHNLKKKCYFLGAIGFGTMFGFWMISSVPRFPAKRSMGYKFEEEQTHYGQMILCVTLQKSSKSTIGILIFLLHTH